MNKTTNTVLRWISCSRPRGLVLILGLTITVCAVCGCRSRTDHKERQSGDIRIHRLERVIMDTPEEQLSAALHQFDQEVATPLLTIQSSDPNYLALVSAYRNDEMMRDIDHIVQHRYGNLGWLERELTEALQKAHQLDPDIQVRAIATYIGSSGYADRVRADATSGTLVIAIDQYALPQMERYGYFGDPQYLVHLSDSAYLAVDCMATLIHEYIVMNDSRQTLLDYMIAEGKELYFLDRVLPHTADSIKLRYTSGQMRWMKQHEEKVWAYLLQQQLLFSTDLSTFHNLIDESPKTNAFGNESAPRTTEYIGWKIVNSYMERSGCSLKELLEDADSQKILSQSGYRGGK